MLYRCTDIVTVGVKGLTRRAERQIKPSQRTASYRVYYRGDLSSMLSHCESTATKHGRMIGADSRGTTHGTLYNSKLLLYRIPCTTASYIGAECNCMDQPVIISPNSVHLPRYSIITLAAAERHRMLACAAEIQHATVQPAS